MKKFDRRHLFMIIEQASFALDDVKLFLDTHPDCTEAIEYYEKMQKIRQQAWREYTINFGPLSAYDVDIKGTWDWNCAPLPWESEGC